MDSWQRLVRSSSRFSPQEEKLFVRLSLSKSEDHIMVRIEIWIASHLHSQQRFEWAKSMVKSLAGSTLKPNVIYISTSKESYVKGDLKELFDLYPSLNVVSVSHLKRQTQFQHFQHIYSMSKDQPRPPGTFIFFCDDDDMYDPLRIEVIRNYIHDNLTTFVFHDLHTLVDGSSTPEKINIGEEGYSDFANYVISYSVLQEFFEDVYNPELLPGIYSGLADCAFRAWLHPKENVVIDRHLYYARKVIDVPFSSCWSLDMNVDFSLLVKNKGLDTVLYRH